MDPFDLQYARDIDVPLFDRSASIRREPSILDAVIQPIAAALIRTWMRVFHRMQIVNIENLPKDPPYVLVANHTSHLDTLAMMSALPRNARHCAHPLAAHDTFYTSHARAILAAKLINALPVRRSRADSHALDTLRSRLVEDREVLIIYPEGTRSDGQFIRPFLPGIGRLVAGTTVPVVPCRLNGCASAMPKGRWLPRTSKITLQIGKSIIFADQPETKQASQYIAETLHDAVVSL